MTIALRYAARSDVGLVRSNNQDSAYAGPHLLLVADGMGGHAGGDIASSLTVASLAPLDGEAFGSHEILQRLERAIETARLELVRRAREDAELGGMGTTVTALLRSGNKLAMAHMGDSRAYVLRDGRLSQVTKDHTFVQHLVDTGKITPDEAEHHPQRSVVMRVLGDFDLELSPDLSVREAHPGDRWLLCSDGLSGFVSAETLERTLNDVEDVDACAERLIQLALRAGGSDNITCIVADILDLDDVPDGDGPYTGVQVVGSVAISRDAPTVAADGPAARAAALLAEARATVDALTDPDAHPSAVPLEPAPSFEDVLSDEETLPPPKTSRRRRKKAEKAARTEARAAVLAESSSDDDAPRYRWLWTILSVLVVGGILGAGAWFGYRWTQTQYYVGVESGRVAIFQGIAQSAGPVSLSSVVETTDLETATLDSFVANQLDRTIRATSLEDARARVADLIADAEPEPEPEPTDGTG